MSRRMHHNMAYKFIFVLIGLLADIIIYRQSTIYNGHSNENRKRYIATHNSLCDKMKSKS